MVSFKITNITYDTYDEEAEEHQTQEDLELPTEMVVQIELQGDEEEWEIYDLLTYQIENQGYGWLVESFDFDTESKSAEGLEFTDWAKQETKHHGKTSLKDWADHEIKTHGKSMSFQDWAKHEDKSHIRRYGADYDSMKNHDWAFGYVGSQWTELHCRTCGEIAKIQNEDIDAKALSCRKEKFGAEEDNSHLQNPKFTRPYINEVTLSDAAIKVRPLLDRGHLRLNDTQRKAFTEYSNGVLDAFTYLFEFWYHPVKETRANVRHMIMQTDWKENKKLYGAEELKRDSCCCGATKSNPCACMIQGIMKCNATCPCSLEKKGAEEYPCDGCGVFSNSLSLIRGKGIDPGNPMQICSRCISQDEGCRICEEYGDCESANCPESAEYEAENWGGDPTGKLALMLQKVRDKAKKPKKPLKIEKLDAAPYTLGYSYDNPPDEENETLVEWYDEYLKDEEWKDMGLTEPESFEDYSKRITKEYDEYLEKTYREMREYDEYVQERMDDPEYTTLDAETSGQWEIGEQLEEAQMNAESFATEGKSFVCDACEETLPLKLRNRSLKVAQEFGMGMGDICRPCVKRIKSYQEEVSKLNPPKTWADYYNAPTKGIDTFTKPFEESSLDSGTVKSIVVGLGIGALALFGYNKWK